MKKANQEIRQAAKKFSVSLWEIADFLQISEPTLFRWLRHELSDEQKNTFFKAIEAIRAEKATTA